MLGAWRAAALTEITSLAFTTGFTILQFAFAMPAASNLSFRFPTARAVPVAVSTNESSRTLASGFFAISSCLTFAVTIANISVRVGRTFNMAFVASVTFLAHTLGLFRLRVHETRTLPRTHIALTLSRAFHSAVLSQETFLTFAHCLALATLFHTCASFLTTTDTS